MNKKQKIVLLIIAVVIVVFFLSRGKGDTPIVIKSADGMVSLEIPQESLPKNVQASDIKVQTLATQSFFGNKEDPAGPAYELLPDGMVFSKPITLHIVSPSKTSGVIPQILHVSKSGAIEVLNPSLVRINLAQKKVEADFSIEHFSRIGIDIRHGTFTYNLVSGGSARVGEKLPFSLTIEVEPHLHWYQLGVGYGPDITKRDEALRSPRDRGSVQDELPGGFTYRVAPGTVYTISQSEIRTGTPILSPSVVSVPSKDLKEYQPYRFETKLTCERAGHAAFLYEQSILYRMERGADHTNNRPASYRNEDTKMFIQTEPYECVAASDEEKKELETLVIDGAYFPKKQFHTAHPDQCAGDHYHGPTVYGLQNKTSTTVISLPQPAGSCGFGIVSNISTETILITPAQASALGALAK